MVSGIILQSLRLNICVMKIFHLYPREEQTFSYKAGTYAMYILLVPITPALSILYLLLEDDWNMERVNYNAAFVAQVTCFVTKLLPFVLYGERIKQCIDYFDNFGCDVENVKHKQILADCIRNCRRNTWAFFICAIGAVSSWATKPAFWEGRNFPVDIWLPFDATEDIVTYCFVYFIVATGPLAASTVTGVVDPLIAGLAYHATSQMKILKDTVRHLSQHANQEISDKGLNVSAKPRIIYDTLRKCIDHHEAILKFTEEYQTCFSWVVFSQIAASVFVVCFTCLQLTKIETFGYYFVQLIVYFSVILGEIYFYCYYGALLSQECDSLAESIYMGQWYEYDLRNKKILLTLMERCKKPVIVRVGKLVDLSLDTFTTILRRSYSLLAVLKNYQ